MLRNVLGIHKLEVTYKFKSEQNVEYTLSLITPSSIF